MKFFLLVTLNLLSFFSSRLAFARAYGDAGCGLGSIIMGKDGNQVLAATSNASSWTQPFGISSGTSNCADDGAVNSAKTIPMFIEVNKANLAKDASRGDGEFIATLAQLMGCNSKSLGTTLKSNYEKIFIETQMEPSEIESKINSAVSANRAQSCDT